LFANLKACVELNRTKLNRKFFCCSNHVEGPGNADAEPGLNLEIDSVCRAGGKFRFTAKLAAVGNRWSRMIGSARSVGIK